MTQAGDLFLSRTIQLTAFGAVYSTFFALASIISLLSVYRLRKRQSPSPLDRAEKWTRLTVAFLHH